MSRDEQGERPCHAGRAGCYWTPSFFPLPWHRQVSPENIFIFFILLSHLPAVTFKGLAEEKTNYTVFPTGCFLSYINGTLCVTP